jgi:TonB family protein
VKGDLHAVTAGGHIHLANVQGNAVLRSGGGHIRGGTIQGKADIETGGGNIFVQRAGSVVTASTVGGQIDFGEAAGSIRARTGGGVIRVLRVVRPTLLETSGGNIFLTKVQSAVRASSGSGTITAWFTPEERGQSSADNSDAPWPRSAKANQLPAGCQLESRQGDIVVYLPRELAATIEASIEMAAGHRIEADPALPIKLSYSTRGPGGREIHGEGSLNGGGEVLRLKTSSGSIRLKVSDWLTTPMAVGPPRRPLELERDAWFRAEASRRAKLESEARQVPDAHESGAVEEIQRRIEQIWWGGVRVAPDAQRQKLVQEVAPAYPDAAKQAGIEGMVKLRAVVAKNGAVQGIKVLSGEGILANAAVEAVRQWRYQPTWIDGRPVNVVTTITVDFHLR